ncbi:MAG TPA: hypothetical protein VJA94_00780, partial [Candidatus Angelobacter sp.]
KLFFSTMRRHTAKDRAFGRKFAQKLWDAFQWHTKNKDNPARISVQEFARSLNLTRAGLHKAMSGKSIPELDLIERARKYNVVVGYGDLETAALQKKVPKVPEAQLFLPFAVENLKKDNVRVELGDHRKDTVEVRVWIKFAG